VGVGSPGRLGARRRYACILRSLCDLFISSRHFTAGQQLTASIFACKLAGILEIPPRPLPPIPNGPCIPPLKPPPGAGRPGTRGAEADGI
jgi:hypothetical protein